MAPETMTRTRDPVSPPPTPAVSPELVLVDERLADQGAEREAPERGTPRTPLRVVEPDLRDAILRICELSDVNPPRRTRGARLLAFSGVATLWVEVALVVATQGRLAL